jgi:hypothetical protein
VDKDVDIEVDKDVDIEVDKDVDIEVGAYIHKHDTMRSETNSR